MHYQTSLLLLAILLLTVSCSGDGRQAPAPMAQVLASGPYPGGHFELQSDNGLRVLLNFNEIGIDSAAAELGRGYYGTRPQVLPDQQLLADRELLSGPGGWVATCRRDGNLEVWQEDDPDTGFSSYGELYTPLGVWLDGQYPVTDVCRLLEERVLTTSRDQSVVCLDYNGRERWSFLMGAPARLLYMLEADQILAASDDGRLYALDSEGQLLWQQETASHCAALLSGMRAVFVAPDGALVCVDSAGQELWCHNTTGVPDELRSCADTLWYRLAGELHCMDATGQELACDWPAELAVRDIVTGLNGEVFIVGTGGPDLQQSVPATNSVRSAQLFCYDGTGLMLWQYDRLDSDFSLIPAHERQCWLVRLGNNMPELRRIGLPYTSQDA